MIRSQPPRAVRRLTTLVLLLVTITCLSGCNDRFWETLALLVLVVVAIMVVTYGALLAVLIVNIVKLLRGRPSLGWGVTSLVCGGMTGLSALSPLVSHLEHGSLPTGLSLGSIGLAGALVFFGLRNVRGARASATSSNQAPRIEPPAAPPPPPDTRAPP